MSEQVNATTEVPSIPTEAPAQAPTPAPKQKEHNIVVKIIVEAFAHTVYGAVEKRLPTHVKDPVKGVVHALIGEYGPDAITNVGDGIIRTGEATIRGIRSTGSAIGDGAKAAVNYCGSMFASKPQVKSENEDAPKGITEEK